MTATSAKLFFTPIDTNEFFISFSETIHAEEHGEQVVLSKEGVQSHTVYLLKPNTTYYFKVRGNNACATGDWSNIMQVKTRPSGFLLPTSFYRYYPATRIVLSQPNHPQPTPQVPKSETLSIPTPTSTVTTPTPKPEPTVVSQTPPSQSPKKCFLWWCW